jgi:hypothetical protein
MIVDVSTFVGAYPYRHLPDATAASLLAAMDRVGIGEAWVGHLSSFLYRDPAAATEELLRRLDGTGARLRPVPTIHPGLPSWTDDLHRARDAGAPAVRVYPMHQDLVPDGPEMHEAVSRAGDLGLPVLLTVRFEDVRQRHPLDVASDLPPSAVRALARIGSGVRLLVTHAGRDFVEEVHFGLTPDEARRVLWDVTWIWGPPYDDLHTLVATVGAERFVFGTAMPLRIPEAAPAKLDLSRLSSEQRAGIESGNLARWETA